MSVYQLITESYYRIKTKALILTLCLAVLLCVAPLHADVNSGGEKIFNPENTSWIYAYGGYGYYRWKMMSMEGLIDLFTSDLPSTGMKFRHESTPYIVKKYGVKTNFLLFSLGLDYLGDTLDLPFEFDSEKKFDEREGRRARQLRYLSGLNYKNLSFQFNITHREFDSTITSQGYTPVSYAGDLPIYYYPESGSLIYLAKGDKTAWYTEYTDYEVKIIEGFGPYMLDIGVRYTRYDAPTELSISAEHKTGDLLMFTENRMVTLFMGAGRFSHLAGDFYMHFYFPVNIAGYYYAENDYFKVKNKLPFSSDTLSITASSSGNFSLAYILKYCKIEGGVDYGMFYSQLMLSDAELKKDVEYRALATGETVTAPAGSRADITAKRLEFFWGFYLHASVYF